MNSCVSVIQELTSLRHFNEMTFTLKNCFQPSKTGRFMIYYIKIWIFVQIINIDFMGDNCKKLVFIVTSQQLQTYIWTTFKNLVVF